VTETAVPIVVVARWLLSDDTVDGVLSLLADVSKQSIAEPGCLGYDVFRSVDVVGELLLVERYRDDASIVAHRASKHYQELVVQQIVPLLKERHVELLQARDRV
jgi:quinol monooxygenase YgiN